jgi:DNA (cytosine-5)-methyltransferase 1
VDLFCGCGGLTLGLKQAGFAVIGAIEIDPLAVKTYRANHPEVYVWAKDIKEVSPRSVMRRLALRKGQLDLLAGCPPCQGFSSVRTLNGSRVIHDDRNDLLAEFLRFVEALRPRTVMMENVPGLASDARFAAYRRRLRELGYQEAYRLLDAADYGVAQRRRRLISLAGREGSIRFARRGTRRLTVRIAIGSLPRPGKSGDPLHDLAERRTRRIRNLIKAIPRNGGSRRDLPRRRWLRCHKTCDGFADVYGRMAWNDVAPTITGGCINPSKGRFLHPSQNRAITPREAALLQGFPRDYAFILDEGRFRVAEMIGNALPPEFVRRHAHAIAREVAPSWEGDT